MMKAVQGWKPLENGFVSVTVKNMLDGKLIDAELPITPSQILYALNSNPRHTPDALGWTERASPYRHP